MGQFEKKPTTTVEALTKMEKDLGTLEDATVTMRRGIKEQLTAAGELAENREPQARE
jgi:hypothetical protein